MLQHCKPRAASASACDPAPLHPQRPPTFDVPTLLAQLLQGDVVPLQRVGQRALHHAVASAAGAARRRRRGALGRRQAQGQAVGRAGRLVLGPGGAAAARAEAATPQEVSK